MTVIAAGELQGKKWKTAIWRKVLWQLHVSHVSEFTNLKTLVFTNAFVFGGGGGGTRTLDTN